MSINDTPARSDMTARAVDWDAIRLALVEAGMPLEVLLLSGRYHEFTPELQASIIKGAQAVRRMLKELT